MTAEEFRERFAHSRIEPWGNDWEQTATIAKAVFDASTQQILLKVKNQEKVAKALAQNVDDFIPLPRWLRRKRRQERKVTRG